MIKKPGGDIDGLFRSFGSDGGAYRELAREADAQEAQQRWPMLGEIAPEAAERPAELDASSKRHWHAAAEAPLDPLPTPTASAEGTRLVGGLDALLRRGDSTQAPAPTPAPPTRVEPAQREDVRRPAAGGLFQAGRRPEPEAHRDDPRRGARGLFSGLTRGAPAKRSADDDSLSDVFSRLEGDARGTRRLGPGRNRKR